MTARARASAPRIAPPLAVVVLVATSSARALETRFPGGFVPPGSPPAALARSHPVVLLPARVLSVRLTQEQFRHSQRALAATDPGTAALARALVMQTRVELGYGLGGGIAAQARLGWGSFDPRGSTITPVGSDGGGEDRRQVGFEDVALAVNGTASTFGGRLAGRLEGGLVVPSGNDRAYENGSGLTWTPFTVGEPTPFGGVAMTLALSQPEAPVGVHLHAEGTLLDRRRPEPGIAPAPFPERLPLVLLGADAHDRLDLRFAFSVSRPQAVLFAELDLPLLHGARAVIAPRESPITVTPGFALRLGFVQLGAQLDLPVAVNEDATPFNPHRAYPDWGLRLRLATDLVPLDRDRDGDGIGDRSDRCPNDPEDRDRYADRDGCPDPDNDGDSILDFADACPQVAEDPDGFADEDGCPDPDNDGDGIPDVLDLCPLSAEDMDGVDDEDGCPDADEAPPPAEPR